MHASVFKYSLPNLNKFSLHVKICWIC